MTDSYDVIISSMDLGELIDIQKINPNIAVELKYAAMYDFDRCFLLKGVAEALNEVQKEVEQSGFRLKVWDGYRPMAVQWKFWELLPDERYVSDPRKGGRHTRGTAVDLTLIDANGRELLMPTPFDDFTEKAHADCADLPAEAIRNREFLRTVMERRGFSMLKTEWWHFDFQGWEQRPPLDCDVNPH